MNSDTSPSGGPALKQAGRWARMLLAAVIAAAFVGLVIFLAAMLTAAALVVAGLALLAGGAYWLWRKLSGGRGGSGGDGEGGSGDPTVLVARRGPQGWTVERAGL